MYIPVDLNSDIKSRPHGDILIQEGYLTLLFTIFVECLYKNFLPFPLRKEEEGD